MDIFLSQIRDKSGFIHFYRRLIHLLSLAIFLVVVFDLVQGLMYIRTVIAPLVLHGELFESVVLSDKSDEFVDVGLCLSTH